MTSAPITVKIELNGGMCLRLSPKEGTHEYGILEDFGSRAANGEKVTIRSDGGVLVLSLGGGRE